MVFASKYFRKFKMKSESSRSLLTAGKIYNESCRLPTFALVPVILSKTKDLNLNFIFELVLIVFGLCTMTRNQYYPDNYFGLLILHQR